MFLNFILDSIYIDICEYWLLCLYFANHVFIVMSPLSSNRQHYHIDDCLEYNREDY